MTTDRELIQQALAALENTCIRWPDVEAAIAALRERLAQPEDGRLLKQFLDAAKEDGVTHLTVQQPEQEPVAWHHPECKGECIACLIQRAVQDEYGTQGLDYLLRHVTSVSTQPRREWQGLTDDDLMELPGFDYDEAQFIAEQKFARAIEAKLKEKNA